MAARDTSLKRPIGLTAFGARIFTILWAVSLVLRQPERRLRPKRGGQEPPGALTAPDPRDEPLHRSADTPPREGLLAYFALVFAVSVPFWLLGDDELPLPVHLPLSALTAFSPAIAAALLSYHNGGWTGVRRLIRRAVDYRRIPDRRWLAPTLLLAPLLYVMSYLVMRAVGLPLPESELPLLSLVLLFGAFLLPIVGEELGWTAYATDRLLARMGALRAALALGVVWAIWHGVTFVQTGNTLEWVVGQSVKTLAMRVILVWLYSNTGRSVSAAILYHAADNAAWSAFPHYGSHYNPWVTGALNWLIVAVVAYGWGARTLAERRSARQRAV